MSASLRWPLILVLCSILFGSGLGIAFGISEARLKEALTSRLALNVKLEALPEAQRDKEGEALTSKAWQYFKRAHMHGGAIAALSLGLILLLNHLAGSSGLKIIAAYFLAIGGFIYPLFWLASGWHSPVLGTSAAKENFQWLAAGGVLHTAGVVMTLIVAVRRGAYRGTRSGATVGISTQTI